MFATTSEAVRAVSRALAAYDGVREWDAASANTRADYITEAGRILQEAPRTMAALSAVFLTMRRD